MPIEGKTKRPARIGDGISRFICKDDVTAGDGRRHEVIKGKGELVASTVAATSALLKSCGFPLAIMEQDSANSYLAYDCQMIPLEVVGRLESFGSYAKRFPHHPVGFKFKKVKTELFLKTKGKVWTTPHATTYGLECDDPYLLPTEDLKKVRLFLPNVDFKRNEYFLELDYDGVFPFPPEVLDTLLATTGRVTRVLGYACNLLYGRLIDVKLEFGFLNGEVVIAEAPSFEEWRLVVNDEHLDKEPFRRGASLSETLRVFNLAADFASHLPQVQDKVAKWWKKKNA